MEYQNINRKRNQGFTLIEIMVVLVIIGVMAALIVPRTLGRVGESRKVAAKADIAAIMTALKLYNLDNMRYPTNAQGLAALINKPNVAPIPNNYKDGGYIEKLPADPWGNQYQYQNPGRHGEVDVYSYGENGQESGGGENGSGVIGNWQ